MLLLNTFIQFQGFPQLRPCFTPNIDELVHKMSIWVRQVSSRRSFNAFSQDIGFSFEDIIFKSFPVDLFHLDGLD